MLNRSAVYRVSGLSPLPANITSGTPVYYMYRTVNNIVIYCGAADDSFGALLMVRCRHKSINYGRARRSIPSVRYSLKRFLFSVAGC